MKQILILLTIALTLTSCYTSIRRVSHKPEKFINKEIRIKGYAQRWIKSNYGYYFIVLTNRYKRNPVIIYKQVPYLQINSKIKAQGILRHYHKDKTDIYILIDSTKARKIFRTSIRKQSPLEIYFRDTLPPDCLFFIQNNF